MNSPETRLAFDIGRYAGYEISKARHQLADDLSALVLELAPAPEKRITPFIYAETREGKVVSPEFGNRDIRELLRWETKSDILESRAALKIRDQILSEKDSPFIIIWISPASEELGYKEGRMVVGIGKKDNGLNRVETYGICVDFLPGEDLFLANNLLEFSENEKGLKIKSRDELIATPIFIKPPKKTNPLGFIAELILLPDVWERIRTGEAEALKKQAADDARAIAQKVMPEIIEARSRQEFIEIGARIERQMMAAGWEMRRNSGCGSLNTDLAGPGAVPIFTHSHFHLKQEGNSVPKGSEGGVFVQKCPYCGRSINTVINPGYTCTCGQKYLGAC